MRRTAALLALTALSWSQLVGLRCDMDTPDAGPSAPMPAGHHHPADEDAPPAPHGDHGADGGCLMILAACAASSARPARTATLVRLPAVFVRADVPRATIPVAIALAIETPPPRHPA